MRRLPARTVLWLSLAACLVCLLVTLWVGFSARSAWALLPLALAVWFGVDAWRARGWLSSDAP